MRNTRFEAVLGALQQLAQSYKGERTKMNLQPITQDPVATVKYVAHWHFLPSNRRKFFREEVRFFSGSCSSAKSTTITYKGIEERAFK